MAQARGLFDNSDERHFASTDDGWRLCIARYRPTQKSDRPPLILCHGLGANRFNFDLTRAYSLARYLADLGWDCFVLELRGAGLSHRRVGVSSKALFSFDDYVKTDVPAAIQTVARITNRNQFYWLGHSMGGLVAMAYQGMHHDPNFCGLIAVASPTSFRHHAPRIRRIVRLGGKLPFGFHARWWVPHLYHYLPRFREPGGPMLARSKREDRRLIDIAAKNLPSNIPRPVLKQFHSWLRRDGFCSADGTIDYFDLLTKIDSPALFIVGTRDVLCPAKAVQGTYAQWGSEDKTILICSKENGFLTDYDHGSILLGEWAHDEVFPKVADWLIQRATLRQKAD